MPAQHLLLVASAALVGVLEFGGVPIPGGPLLVALSATVTDPATAVLTTLAAALGAMCADAIWFTIGRRRGLALVHAYCRFTLGSRECAATTTRFFQRLGPRALIIGKFVPGLAAFGAPFAGLAGVSWGRFLAWDLVGSLLRASAWVAAGRTLGRPLLAQVAARSGGLQVVLIALVAVPAAVILAGRLWRQVRYGALSETALQAAAAPLAANDADA